MTIRSAKLFFAGTSDVVLALQRRSDKLLAAGGDLLTRAGALEKQAANEGDTLYQRLGGYAAFGKRINFQALWSQLLQDRSILTNQKAGGG